MKVQIPLPPIARTIWLGVLTLTLVVLAADGRVATIARDEAAAGHKWAWSTSQRKQTPPPHQDSQRPGASQPRAPFWKDPAIIKEIKLTPDQAAKIDAVWRKREQDMLGPALELAKQETELKRMLAERKVGVDVIGMQSDRVEAQRTVLAKSRTIMLYQFWLILSPGQNTGLRAIWERDRRERR
ncbi:MAG: hypothetical protein EXQ49_03645 [Acidobacteria bacterium]|nr:hypothetical protein [Acidobacteriota bacterium]